MTPLDTKYALLDPEMRAQAKREALGLPPPAPSKQAKSSKEGNKETGKKTKPSKDSNKEHKEKSAKTLPDALKQVQTTYSSKFHYLYHKCSSL